MKKILLIGTLFLSAIAFSVAGGNEITSHDTPLDNGFSLKFHIGLPGQDYGLIEGTDPDGILKPGITYGLEIGNQWYVYKDSDEKFGIGIFANWFDFDFGSKKESEGLLEIQAVYLNWSFLEVGPVFTYAINDDIGIDAYYQLCPTLVASGFSDNISNETDANVGFGFTHSIGAAFRYRLLYAGLEYKTGDVEVVNSDFSEIKYDAITNNLRILLGFKF